MKYELVSQIDPKSPVAEIFKTLRTNIQFMNSNNQLKTLLVTSTVSQEGKSWISTNLAITFAQAGKRVVLIDGDMRRARIHEIFGISQRPGLSNYLSGVYDNNNIEENLEHYVRETEIPNLFVIPSGNIPPNPSELLVGPKMVELLDMLKNECDLVIIDGTPSKLVTDSIIISRLVDSTIIVASHNHTKKNDLTECVKSIKNVGGKIAGIIYNRAPQNPKAYKEKYYYSSDIIEK